MTPHGSYSTYTNHKCRCTPCREAHNAWTRQRRAERAQIARDNPELVPHGRGGYENWGCRCQVCRDGHAAGHRKAKARKLGLTPPSDLYTP